jgi:hypothetical protein
VPTTVDGALRLAVKLAIDGGDYERAAEVLGILKRRRDGPRGTAEHEGPTACDPPRPA